ncbi:MAG: formylglycine-generating enzyme family protein [Acidobacteriota bacterium]|nr:formylglycine-generating enzyme family protein [Acidobacteriota bacterium]
MSSPPVARTAIEVEPALVRIPEGWFQMGHPQGFDSERPVHRVWVDAFLMAARQVANTEYARFLDSTQSPPPLFFAKPGFDHPQQPVVGVSWFEAVAYCEWLSHQTGKRYRLPTEAEWECAARGGREGTLYPWGEDPPQSRAGYRARWITGPEPVGGTPPNASGLYDMCENVHEWCSDWFDAEYYASSPARDPRGPEAGTRRASRGGSWRHHVKTSCCHTRSSIPPQFQYADYGFRVACDVD